MPSMKNSHLYRNLWERKFKVLRNNHFKKSAVWTPLVVQLRIFPARVPALVWEDPTCCGATKPVRHNY